MKLWTAFKLALFAGTTIVMAWHWSVTEAYAEPVPCIVATESNAMTAPTENIFFAERIPSGHWVNAGRHRITHYDGGACCNGKNAWRTASGAPMTVGRTVAASAKEFPFGTKLLINGNVYTVEDRGVGRGCIDILVDSHSEARKKGLYYTDIHVWRED